MKPETTETETETESLSGSEFVYRAIDAEVLSVTDTDEGGTVIEGRMMPYGEHSHIRSAIEARQMGIHGDQFLESFAHGSLAKTMTEQASRIRAMFEHGRDATLGRQLIATVDGMREEQDGAYFRATLLSGVPKLLSEGIRKGLYGSSIRFKPLKYDLARRPKRSESNPDGIPEVTVREALMKEFSITPFPQYAGATAHVRSITDEIAAKHLLEDPKRLLEIINESEPQHSPPEQPEVPEVTGSRSTQPQRDYLNQDQEDPKWLIP